MMLLKKHLDVKPSGAAVRPFHTTIGVVETDDVRLRKALLSKSVQRLGMGFLEIPGLLK